MRTRTRAAASVAACSNAAAPRRKTCDTRARRAAGRGERGVQECRLSPRDAMPQLILPPRFRRLPPARESMPYLYGGAYGAYSPYSYGSYYGAYASPYYSAAHYPGSYYGGAYGAYGAYGSYGAYGASPYYGAYSRGLGYYY